MDTPQHLILDNDDMTSGLLELTLEFIGECSWKVFTSPSQLLEYLKHNKASTIICNVTTRGCDPRELFENKEIDIPLVFISSLYKTEERRSCYLESDFPYITCPYTPELLQAHL